MHLFISIEILIRNIQKYSAQDFSSPFKYFRLVELCDIYENNKRNAKQKAWEFVLTKSIISL